LLRLPQLGVSVRNRIGIEASPAFRGAFGKSNRAQWPPTLEIGNPGSGFGDGNVPFPVADKKLPIFLQNFLPLTLSLAPFPETSTSFPA
jgi:hypothetical protein